MKRLNGKQRLTLQILNAVPQQWLYECWLIESSNGRLTRSSIHTPLAQLYERGLIESHRVLYSQGPARFTFRITPAGQAELHRAPARRARSCRGY